MAFVARSAVKDFVASRRGIKLRGARRAFAFTMASQAVQNRTQFHRFRARIAEREYFKAFLERRVVEMLPSIGEFGTRVHFGIGPGWRRNRVAACLEFLVDSCHQNCYVQFPYRMIHHRSAKYLNERRINKGDVKRGLLGAVVNDVTFLLNLIFLSN